MGKTKTTISKKPKTAPKKAKVAPKVTTRKTRAASKKAKESIKKSKTITKKGKAISKKTRKSKKAAAVVEEKEVIKSKAIKKTKKTKAQEPVETDKPATLKDEKKRIKRKIEDFTKFKNQKRIDLLKQKKKLLSLIKIDKKLVAKAISELKKFTVKTEAKNPLLVVEDGFVYIDITLNQLPETFSIRPVEIPLPTAIYSPDYFSKHCVIVRSPEREFKDKIESLDIPCVGKVIGYEELNNEYRRYEAKRDLCKEFDLFFCDYTIYDLLRKPLGKVFYDRKKIPFPIDCKEKPGYCMEKDYQGYLNSLSKSTYFIQGNGPNYALKVGRITQTAKELQKNVVAALYTLSAHLLCEGEDIDYTNIRRICIKTYNSPSLPVYSFLTEREKNHMSEAIENL